MEQPLNYEKTLKIEVLNEFGNGVYGKLINYMFQNNINTEDPVPTTHYAMLLEHLSKLLNMNLFDKPDKELEDIKRYFIFVNEYVKELMEGNN